jgi:glutaredoxin
MKKIGLYILFFIILILPFSVRAEQNEVRLYLFHKESCRHCKEEIKFLDSIKDDYPNLDIVMYEIEKNEMNYNFYLKVIDKTGLNVNGVPFAIIGTDYYVGYSDSIGKSIKESIEKFSEIDSIDVISYVKDEKDLSNIKYNVDPRSEVDIPILGNVNAKDVSLPLISIILGTVDGFNPCAMWVLLFLISMLFNMKDKKKMWILGITFLLTSAIVYLFFMLAWLKVAVSFSTITWLKILIALVALVGGLVNLNSYRKSNKKDVGCEVVDDKKRKKIFNRIKDITSQNKFILALLGIITLAVSVNLVELACSAGLPLIFTQILALNDLNGVHYAIYMFLYILFFLLDDIIIFVISMATLNLKGISAKYGKYSHLIGGIVMVLIGLLMLFKPEWLMFSFK